MHWKGKQVYIMLTAQVLDRERTSARCVISCQRSRSSPNHPILELHLAEEAVMTPKCGALRGLITKGLCHRLVSFPNPLVLESGAENLSSHRQTIIRPEAVKTEVWTMSMRLTKHVLEA